MLRHIRKTPLLLIAIAALQCGATDCGEIVTDPGFDLWCGEQLCSWKIARGTVDQVPTWHEGDDGADLLGGDTAIYQLTPVTFADGACIEFTLVADIDPGVDVRFQADIYGDGSIELDQPIPAADWQPLVYRFAIDGPYQGITFWIVKRSEGHAVVAQLQAHTCENGQTAGVHLAPPPAPDGAECGLGVVCGSGVCEQFPGAFSPPATCGECEIGTTCPTGGEVCGLAAPTLYTLGASTACVPAASKPLGALCGVNEECVDGSCAFGVCSTCFGGSCGPDETCDLSIAAPLPDVPGVNYPAPLVCSPRGGLRVAGEPCVTGPDCASGLCTGAPRQICDDGRACANDADCPVSSGLDHQSCVTVGVIGGTCQ